MFSSRQNAFILALILVVPSVVAIPASGTGPAASVQAESHLDPTPVSDTVQRELLFEKNLGQHDPEIYFVARSREGLTAITADGFSVIPYGHRPTTTAAAPDVASESTPAVRDPPSEPVRMRLGGAQSPSRVRGEGEAAYTTNYYLGNEPARWREQVPHFDRVELSDVYPGIDLAYHGTPAGEVEYDFIVAPHADPDLIQLVFEGIEALAIEESGDLVLTTPDGPIMQRAPVAYQTSPAGGEVPVASSYRLVGNAAVGISVGAYDPRQVLVIDPVVVYSTYLSRSSAGGGTADAGHGIAADAPGNAHVVGWSSSIGYDAFTAKYDSLGELERYRTMAASSGDDSATAVAVDAVGDLLVGGETCSSTFPGGGGVSNPGCSGFVSKIDPGGSFVYTTFLGGSAQERVNGVAWDAAGNAFATGNTCSADFPTLNASQSTYPSAGCNANAGSVFVAKLASSGALQFSTFLGGSSFDEGHGIATDAFGGAIVTGIARSTNFPTRNASQPAYPGGPSSGFVARFTSSGAVDYATYLGGNNQDVAFGVTVDRADNAWVTGRTCSANFPASNAMPGGCDAFIATFDPQGRRGHTSYLGGTGGPDTGWGIAADPADNILLAGSSCSTQFPTTADAFQADYPGGACSAFVAKLNSSGAVTYATYLGGNDLDAARGIALDASGNFLVTGQTCSNDFPTVRAHQGSKPASRCAAFVTKFADTDSLLVGAANPCPNAGGSLDTCRAAPPADNTVESPTGNTPFGGSPLKPTFPGAPSPVPVNLATGEVVARFRALHLYEPAGDDFTFDLTFRSVNNPNGTAALGARWNANWLQHLEARATDYIHHTGDGRL